MDMEVSNGKAIISDIVTNAVDTVYSFGYSIANQTLKGVYKFFDNGKLKGVCSF